MRARAGLATVLAVLAVLAFAPRLAAAAIDAPYRPGEILVKFRSGVSSAMQERLVRPFEADHVQSFPTLGVERYRIAQGSVEDAIRQLKTDPSVVYAEPNYLLRMTAAPNDPLFPQLWGMNNTGQTGGTAGADIHAVSAWSQFTGSSSVVVGVIDTGMDMLHPDLAANLWTNPNEIAGNNVDDDNNGFVDDVHGWDFANFDNDPTDDNQHGTHCSGTIGAVGNNGIGVAGVNWQVTLMPIKFLDAGGSGSTAGAIAAVEYATLMHVDVISASWGGGGYSQALYDAIKAAGDAGIVFCAAAGNASSDNDAFAFYPATYDLDNIVAVAATDHNDQLAGFSNYGLTTVDLAAPGVNILSTTPGGNYALLSGTSMATPHVAGAAAMIRGRFPGAPVATIKSLLMLRTDPLPSLAGKVASGGRLNLLLATADPDSTPPGDVSDLAASQPNGSRVRLDWTAPGDDGFTGTAFAYDVRYSTSPIDSGNFAFATKVIGEPSPSAAGTAETMIVHGLAFSTPYYFALRTTDEFGNPSGVSNMATATTLGPPAMSVSPDSLSANLLTGQKSTQNIAVSNTGVSELLFTVERQPVGSNLRLDPPASEGENSSVVASGTRVPLALLPQLSSGPARKLDVTASEVTGFTDRTAKALGAAGGPGRTVLTPIEEVFGGPDFSFFAGPRSRGNLYHCTTDRTLHEHRLFLQPGAGSQLWFVVYEGTSDVGTYTLVSASRLDTVGTATGWYSSGPVDLPLVAGRSYLIAASWDQPATYYNRQGISPYPIPASLGSLIGAAGWNWAPTSNFPPDGFQDVPPEAFGEPVAYYQSLVTDDQITWISVAPEDGVVPAGLSFEVAATFDAEGLNDGDYDARLLVRGNDPVNPEEPVGVHMHVTGAPDIETLPAAMDFGTPFVGFPRTDTLRVKNSGTATLTVASVLAAPGVFTVDPAGFALAPGASRTLLVTYLPVAAADDAGTITITSNDPDQAVVVVPLHGIGLIPPDIAVTPDSVYAAVFTDEHATRTITIENSGGSDLTWEISAEEAASLVALGARVVRMPPAEEGPGASGATPPSNKAMPEYKTTLTAPVRTAGAKVAVLMDALPWGSNAISVILGTMGTPYDVITSPQLAGINLSAYKLLIVASDQPQFTYNAIVANQAKIDAFVNQGGLLEFHAAGYGWQGGDPSGITLPGGMRIQADFSDTDHVLLPNHPIAAGVPTYFTGTSASHVSFNSIPLNAERIIENQGFRSNLVSYRFGGGRVVASGQTLEFGWLYGQGAGIVLANMIPFMVSGSAPWVSGNPAQGVVPAGTSVQVGLEFDATGLFGGDYHANVHVLSNDPDESDVVVHSLLHVTGIPNVAVAPDSIDFGEPFVGQSRTDTVVVKNIGTSLLTVGSVVTTPSEFSANPSGFTLPPGAADTLVVTYLSAAPGDHHGTLTVHSDDPDQPERVVVLHGVSLVPPDVAVSPVTLSADLISGQTATRTFTIENSGGSDLRWSVFAQGQDVLVSSVRIVQDPPAEEPGHESKTTPAATEKQVEAMKAAVPSTMAGAHVLLIEDALPWGSMANEQVLNLNAIGFDVIPSAQLASVDLTPYRVIILAGDQPTYAYQNFAAQKAKIDAFVQSGGRLEFHGSGFGWQGGDPSGIVLPGGAGVMYDYSYTNQVVAPGHPIVANVPPGIVGDASIVSFPNLPGNAEVIIRNEGSRPSLATWRYGAGRVVACGQPLEYHFTYGYPAGQVLRNLIPWVAGGSAPWLSMNPLDGVVPAGASAIVTVTFDSQGLFGGNYAANIFVDSNDPDEPSLTVEALLHVTGVPDIALQGQEHRVMSVQDYVISGATTNHDLPVNQPFVGGATIKLLVEGDYGQISENATLIVEGSNRGNTGETGTDCTPDSLESELNPAEFANFAADHVVHATVVNSPAVDAFCAPNRHTVTLTYFGPAGSIDFGPVFPGACAAETIVVVNQGTDTLEVSTGIAGSPGFSAGIAHLSIGPLSKAGLPVLFCPTTTGIASGTLTLTHNDPDQGPITVPLAALGVTPPDITVSPDSFLVVLGPNETAVRTITLDNTGGPLLWSSEVGPAIFGAKAPENQVSFAVAVQDSAPGPVPLPPPPDLLDPTLEQVRQGLNGGFANITAAIPSRYDFTEGVTGNQIIDGGFDMYNYGNYFYTAYWSGVQYTDAFIRSGNEFGPQSRYFTRKFPGLFVLAADLTAPGYFQTAGNLGADGFGAVSVATFDSTVGGVPYRVYVKRVYGAGTDPSVNHMFIIPRPPNFLFHDWSSYTGYDYDSVSGLQPGRFYYLLFASTNGGFIDDGHMKQIFGQFMVAAGLVQNFLALSPTNGGLPGGGHSEVQAVFRSHGLGVGEYPTQIVLKTNDPDEGTVRVSALLKVLGIPDIAVLPDSLDFGDRFVGGGYDDTVHVTNEGTDDLHVSGIAVTPGAFSADPSGFTLASGQTRHVLVHFDAALVQSYAGTLTVTSDDPDESTVHVPLTGRGVVPPEIAIFPDSVVENVPPGGSSSRTLAISNLGGSPLLYAIGVESNQGATYAPPPEALVASVAAATKAGASVATQGGDTHHPPDGYVPTIAPMDTLPAGRVLLVMDVYPWGSSAIQSILYANGIPFDQVPSSYVSIMPLSNYRAIIVAGDQPNSTYANLVAAKALIDDYVFHGGRLEFHAAGWGFSGGDPSVYVLPDGVRIDAYSAGTNYVQLPLHPLVHGVPSPFTGTTASHSFLKFLPADALTIVTDDLNLPTLVTYRYGSGRVVASGHTLEYGYSNGQAAGIILANMIPWVAAAAPPWLFPSPLEGVVLPGGYGYVTLSFLAGEFAPGEYVADVIVGSNDPDELTTRVPVHMVVGGSLSTTAVPGTTYRFQLAPVRPTPSSGRANIAFELSRPGHARAVVYDVAGRVVKRLADGTYPAGRQEFAWRGEDEAGSIRPAGIYLLRLDADEGSRTQRIVWVPSGP